MSAECQLNLPPRTMDDADERVAAPLKAAHDKLGFVPNMYTGMANLPPLLQTYLDGYDRFRSECGLSPQEQEVVFLTISRRNGCGYCMAAHSTIADKMSGVPEPVTDALREGHPLPDDRLEALRQFTDIMVETRGHPGHDDLQAFLDAGYREADVLAIILAIAVKTLSNFSNHVLRPEVDELFRERQWTT